MQATLVLNQQFKIFQRGENFSLYVTDKSNRKNSTEVYKYEGWNFNSGNYLFTTDTK